MGCNKVYIDGGANSMGAYKILKPLLFIDDSWIKIFIEPNPECHPYIENEINGLPNCILIKAALTTQNKEYTLITRDDMAGDSAATIMGKDFINLSIGESNQAVPSYLQYNIQGITFDEIINKYCPEADELYIKLDIEGAEFEVLEELNKNYFPLIKKLFVEFHAHNDYMRERRIHIKDYYLRNNIEILNWD